MTVMLLKTLAFAGLATAFVSLPIAMPLAAGAPVTLAVGAVEVHFHRQSGLDLEFKSHCLVETCPLAQVRFDRAKPEQDADSPIRLIHV
ncbi:MAG: hypothetical protein CMF75_01545 [Maricaulis sp.]|nr:hypothetical protein [Maricaulis sp.]